MDEISWSRPRVSLSKTHITCVVCGLRSGALVCDHCTALPEASITWLEKLPSLSPPQEQALAQLRKMRGDIDNYYDGEWRPVVGPIDTALDVLRKRGFEIGADDAGRLMARWPIAPAAPLTTCRSCLIKFEDINGHALCDSCLVDRVNGAGELELDDPDDIINQPPLTFTDIPLEYWREEVRLNCAVSLARLKAICESRGASYEATIEGLREIL